MRDNNERRHTFGRGRPTDGARVFATESDRCVERVVNPTERGQAPTTTGGSAFASERHKPPRTHKRAAAAALEHTNARYVLPATRALAVGMFGECHRRSDRRCVVIIVMIVVRGTEMPRQGARCRRVVVVEHTEYMLCAHSNTASSQRPCIIPVEDRERQRSVAPTPLRGRIKCALCTFRVLGRVVPLKP